VALVRCRYCSEPLSWHQRSDALYCSGKCRVADHRKRKADANAPPVKLKETNAPYDYWTVLSYSSPSRSRWLADAKFVTTFWSNFVTCAHCRQPTKHALKMKMKLPGERGPLLFCDWRCVGRWAKASFTLQYAMRKLV
jgi:endogenous inhibitor of DNA gyrase (YacG/DUF329 family)